MDRRTFLKTVGAAAALPMAAAPAPRRPNIIVILADDLGFADVGFQRCKDFATPYIDRLAHAGVRFTNAYVSHPFCSPTRAGLMTGRYQHRFGHENNPKYDPNDQVAGLPTSEITIAQVLSDAGYITGQIGKWHLGAAPQFHPLKRGFKEQFGFIGGGHDYFKAETDNPNAREYMIPIERNGKPVAEAEYLTDAFSREACAFVRLHDKDPFFLYLAYNSPHTPLQAPKAYLDRVADIQDPTRRSYAAMICAMDDGIGRLVATIETLKLENDTLIFFLSDNGGPTQVTRADNHPYRGEKGQVYDGGIHVPFVVKWPGHLNAGETYGSPIISLDIFSTAAALAGAKIPKDRPIDGVDLMPHLTGKGSPPPHDKLYWRTGGGKAFAVRQGNWKLVKIGNRTELYDLEADIGESKNQATEKPEILSRLETARVSWNHQMVPPLFQSPEPPAKVSGSSRK
jgi:arylsulfatase A-like enzyme